MTPAATSAVRRRPLGLHVPVYQSFPTHRKTLRAAALLKTRVETVMGHMLRLWLWALTNADVSGLVQGGTAEELALAANWDGSPEEFRAALELAGFIQVNPGGFVIHDWETTGGKVLAERSAEAERWHRRTAKEDPESPRGSARPHPPHGGEGEACPDGDSTGTPAEFHRSPGVRRDETRREEKKEVGAAASEPPASAVLLTYPCQGKVREWALTEAFVEQLRTIYPGLDVVAQLRKMAVKMDSGAVSRKTAKGMPRACFTWLDNAVRWGAGSAAGTTGVRPETAPVAPAAGPRDQEQERQQRFSAEWARHRKHSRWAEYEAFVRSPQGAGVPPRFEEWLAAGGGR